MNYQDTLLSHMNSKLHFDDNCPNCNLSWKYPYDNLSIKQKNQLNIDSNHLLRGIYYIGQIEGYECTKCFVIYPKICFFKKNNMNSKIISFSNMEEN